MKLPPRSATCGCECEDEEELLKEVRELPKTEARDEDRVLALVAEAVAERQSVLIFCGSRMRCQKLGGIPWMPLMNHYHLVIYVLRVDTGWTLNF